VQMVIVRIAERVEKSSRPAPSPCLPLFAPLTVVLDEHSAASESRRYYIVLEFRMPESGESIRLF